MRYVIPYQEQHGATAAVPASPQSSKAPAAIPTSVSLGSTARLLALHLDSPTKRAHGAAFTLLTTEPGPDVAPIHERQIVILNRDDWLAWLDLTRPTASAAASVFELCRTAACLPLRAPHTCAALVAAQCCRPVHRKYGLKNSNVPRAFDRSGESRKAVETPEFSGCSRCRRGGVGGRGARQSRLGATG